MRIFTVFWGLIGLATMNGPALCAGETYPTDPISLATGLELAEIYCATCHAVARNDVSAKTDAPAFRDLSSRYPLETLEESLAEGIVTAHEDMPEIAFEPDDIDAFLGYLTSIQSR